MRISKTAVMDTMAGSVEREKKEEAFVNGSSESLHLSFPVQWMVPPLCGMAACWEANIRLLLSIKKTLLIMSGYFSSLSRFLMLTPFFDFPLFLPLSPTVIGKWWL